MPKAQPEKKKDERPASKMSAPKPPTTPQGGRSRDKDRDQDERRQRGRSTPSHTPAQDTLRKRSSSQSSPVVSKDLSRRTSTVPTPGDAAGRSRGGSTTSGERDKDKGHREKKAAPTDKTKDDKATEEREVITLDLEASMDLDEQL